MHTHGARSPARSAIVLILTILTVSIPSVAVAAAFTNIVSMGQVNVNVSDFERSREFYRMLGFTGSVSLPISDSLEVAQAMGFDEEYLRSRQLVTATEAATSFRICQRGITSCFDPYLPQPSHEAFGPHGSV